MAFNSGTYRHDITCQGNTQGDSDADGAETSSKAPALQYQGTELPFSDDDRVLDDWLETEAEKHARESLGLVHATWCAVLTFMQMLGGPVVWVYVMMPATHLVGFLMASMPIPASSRVMPLALPPLVGPTAPAAVGPPAPRPKCPHHKFVCNFLVVDRCRCKDRNEYCHEKECAAWWGPLRKERRR
mmetsp:Transcript_38974/g.87460  ORF Transcript_38974/g.87460 Transcript_38974/m.87460 type:complete len:186 (+) Transcript_38974:71-628(+)